MCGLVGAAGNIGPKHSEMFRDMLFMDVVRGMDSTGIVMVPLFSATTTPSSVVVLKALGLPDALMRAEGADKVFNNKGGIIRSPRVLMGHNRHATMGEVKVENAHPFEFENVVGMHNGTLIKWGDLEGAKDTDVDSYAMMNHIDKHGVVDMWSKMNGAAAITVWDKTKDRLYLARNEERPLFLGVTDAGRVVLWASERWMLTAAASRRGVAFDKVKGEDGTVRDAIYSLPKDRLFTYKVTNVGITQEGEDKLEMAPFVQRATGSVGWAAGSSFKGHNSGKGKLAPSSPYISGIMVDTTGNNWSRGTKRADKDTRGLSFILTGEGLSRNKETGKHEKYWCGAFIDKNMARYHMPRLEVMYDGDDVMAEVAHSEKHSGRIFKTASRLRFHYEGSSRYPTFRIGVGRIQKTAVSATVYKIANESFSLLKDYQKPATPVAPVIKEADALEKCFKDGNNRLLTKQEYWELVCKLGQSCALCGEVLDAETFVSSRVLDGDVCLCSECLDEPSVKHYLNG